MADAARRIMLGTHQRHRTQVAPRFETVNLSVMVVGRSKSGDLAGVLSGAVET